MYFNKLEGFMQNLKIHANWEKLHSNLLKVNISISVPRKVFISQSVLLKSFYCAIDQKRLRTTELDYSLCNESEIIGTTASNTFIYLTLHRKLVNKDFDSQFHYKLRRYFCTKKIGENIFNFKLILLVQDHFQCFIVFSGYILSSCETCRPLKE